MTADSTTAKIRSLRSILLGYIAAIGSISFLRAQKKQKDPPEAAGAGHRSASKKRQPFDLLNEGRYRVLIENSSDIISLINQEGVIVYKSPAITKVLGWDGDDLIGHHAMEVAHPDDRPKLQILFAAVLQFPDQVFKGEFRHLHKDGTYRWVEGVSTNMLAEPSIRAIVFNYRDITDRKEAQVALEQAQADLRNYASQLEERVAERTSRLQESINSLEGVLYHVAHDLRAPLRALDGYVSLMREVESVANDVTAQEYGERIAAAARRMDELIRDLLDYGRLGHIQLNLEPVDLSKEIPALLRHIVHDIERTRAKVSVLPPLPTVLAHPHTLEQVLINLVENALKFVKPKNTPVIRIWAETRDGKVRIFVEDEGIGIAPEYQAKIFRVFERLEATSHYPGTGIGLAIVQKGIERMGGNIGVTSASGEGSRFWVELPAAMDEVPKEDYEGSIAT